MMIAETLISGEWVTSFVVAIIGAVAAGLVSWKKGVAKGRGDKVTLQEPMPEVPVKRIYTPPTFSQHQDLARRVGALESDVREIRREAAEQFRKLVEVGEERKDKIMDRIEAVAVGFHQRVNQIVSEMNKGNSKR